MLFGLDDFQEADTLKNQPLGQALAYYHWDMKIFKMGAFVRKSFRNSDTLDGWANQMQLSARCGIF